MPSATPLPQLLHEMVSKVQAAVQRLKLAELEAKVDHLSSVVVSLSAQLTAAGITPVSTPDGWRT